MRDVADKHAGFDANTTVTVVLCFLAAVLEGVDVQSVGVAAPKIAPWFGLSPSDMGLLFSASLIGLLPGAVVGGRLADHFGRKWVLTISVAVFGLFSLATAYAWDYPSLVGARFLTGLGLGAALPNMIAMAAECSGDRWRTTSIVIVYCGLPMGASLAAAVSLLDFGAADWRTVFYVGGIAPLILAPILAWLLPESRRYRELEAQGRNSNSDRSRPVRPPSTLHVLFGDARWRATVLIWASFYFIQLALYLVMNWLPSLLVARGLPHSAAGEVQILFGVGGIVGSLVMGFMMDRRWPSLTVISIPIGMIASLFWLASAGDERLMLGIAGVALGFFSIGGQSVLYVLAPAYYPTIMRGTGVGSAVAVARLGSITGPVLAGQLLAAGLGSTAVLIASMPGLLVAGACTLLLLLTPRAKEA